MAKPDPKLDIIDEVMRLKSELAEKKQSAVQALLEQRKQIDAKLASLDWEEDQPRRASIGPRKRAASSKPKHCKICDVDGHDMRAHRSQGSKKKKFAPDELAALGLSSGA